MEVVSPRLDTTLHVSRILSDFWEAMRVHFSPQRDPSCGGHVHVTPVSRRNRNKFSLGALKKIAFAAVAHEDFVSSILPAARRSNQYCRPNSQSAASRLRDTLLLRGSKSTAGLKQVAAEIRRLPSEADMCAYMQGDRYVLWNFQNIFPHPRMGRCTGTVEFRGGNQFLNTRGTLAWVAFVLAFITLALDENLLKRFSEYTHPADPKYTERLEKWWTKIGRAAKKSKMARHLPDDYRKMMSR